MGKNKNSKGFLPIKKKIKIQELTMSIIFIHESRINKNIFVMYKTLQNNTSQFTFLAKDGGFKGTRNEGKFLFENMKNYLH